MLSSSDGGSVSLLAYRDAITVAIQFGLGLRNQEVYGLRWSSFASRDRARITEVLSWKAMDSRGKTEKATDRIARVPSLLTDDLEHWRGLLRQHGFSVRGLDFVIPGNITGPQHGVIDQAMGARHMSSNQAQQWRARHMKPAVSAIAKSDPNMASLEGATPYSLRRGGISARLRGENAQSVAAQCGTSLEMLSRHYSYEIDEFCNGKPESLDQQWRRARSSVSQYERTEDSVVLAA